MSDLRFEWDERKDAENRRKHGVPFMEARTVFLDEDALLVPDLSHSGEEDRFVLLGLSARLRVLIVVHCYRSREAIIRIISARRANTLERAQYEERKR